MNSGLPWSCETVRTATREVRWRQLAQVKLGKEDITVGEINSYFWGEGLQNFGEKDI